MVKALGKCFYPNTKVKLQDGTVKQMKDINLGDILENGSIVEAVMMIDNKREPVSLYRIPNEGVGGTDIFVTGKHLVFDKKTQRLIKVENYSNAINSKIEIDWFSCLITSDHKIQIGNELFWDWEDHFIKMPHI